MNVPERVKEEKIGSDCRAVLQIILDTLPIQEFLA